MDNDAAAAAAAQLAVGCTNAINAAWLKSSIGFQHESRYYRYVLCAPFGVEHHVLDSCCCYCCCCCWRTDLVWQTRVYTPGPSARPQLVGVDCFATINIDDSLSSNVNQMEHVRFTCRCNSHVKLVRWQKEYKNIAMLRDRASESIITQLCQSQYVN